MSERYTFKLPDLGEGLPDATVVEWMIKEGDSIRLDEPLVAMETAKAVVEVPAPCSGKLVRTAGGAGSVVNTGAVLAEFELDPSQPQRAAGHDTGHHHGGAEADKAPARSEANAETKGERSDAGTVVGAVSGSDQVRSEAAVSVGGVRAMPAVRALARKLGVDLTAISPSGADGVVTLQDVKRAAADPAPARSGATPAASSPSRAAEPAPPTTRTATSASGRPLRTRPPGEQASGQPEALTGVRRNMARVMAKAQAEVVLTTLNDDADLHAWQAGNDLTARLVRALVTACRAEPGLNAWFDGEQLVRTLHPQVDVGIAVDTPDGLFVPALRNADMLDARGVREGINRLRQQVEARSVPASELTGYTISLSNFGKFAGRYATPIVVPPTVAILAAGRLQHALVPVMGGVETHRLLPLSLSFDHRCVTGGEAARFLRAVLDDLALPA
ncbi:dihydrolipoamide acetyltransferase family protein [Pseudomarimonas salicorniae]|uniref:Dihydrolipoamide acetyltransferase component of pyruvate dehydrogenase complex n=1 Tax=Pseudomarimonas salicorniae TaxID=2933270 RepID=A0ABT0GCE3_9GAMM|nr:dihydrolipoamide acetyltransferase family protein [Lysobacter sp. CAU 1642]MCK7592204.1 2-oxo acid dehydrogenase subunit E2 [Lysobacter sp. CAU 1642]